MLSLDQLMTDKLMDSNNTKEENSMAKVEVPAAKPKVDENKMA